MIPLSCPRCGRALTAQVSERGYSAWCSTCGLKVDVSDPSPDTDQIQAEPSESAVDGLVGLLQLIQLLLCRLDGVDRNQGITVWMRRIEIDCGAPGTPRSSAVRGSTSTTRTRLLNLGGATWRNSEIVGPYDAPAIRELME